MKPDTPIPFPAPLSVDGNNYTYSLPTLLLHFTKVSALLQFETNRIQSPAIETGVKVGEKAWAQLRCAFDRSVQCTSLLKKLASDGIESVTTSGKPTNGKTFLESFIPEARLEV